MSDQCGDTHVTGMSLDWCHVIREAIRALGQIAASAVFVSRSHSMNDALNSQRRVKNVEESATVGRALPYHRRGSSLVLHMPQMDRSFPRPLTCFEDILHSAAGVCTGEM